MTPGPRVSVPHLSQKLLKARFFKHIPELSQLAQCDVDILFNRDSAHVSPDDWIAMANHIKSKWSFYDGVVVLHGTDTMAYSASALSFLLRPCLKPVILTGAQRPLASIRTDARRNLISAVEIAGMGDKFASNQVSVFFDDQLFQGNRVRKLSAKDYHGFDSPHAKVLAEVGTDITFFDPAKCAKVAQKKLAPKFDSRVAMIHLTPGFRPDCFSGEWLSRVGAIVLIVFPSGTATTHQGEFLFWLKEIKRREIPLIVLSEAGADPRDYPAGRALIELGGLWACDMTPECAWVKTSLLLGQKPKSLVQFNALWSQNLSNETTL